MAPNGPHKWNTCAERPGLDNWAAPVEYRLERSKVRLTHTQPSHTSDVTNHIHAMLLGLQGTNAKACTQGGQEKYAADIRSRRATMRWKAHAHPRSTNLLCWPILIQIGHHEANGHWNPLVPQSRQEVIGLSTPFTSGFLQPHPCSLLEPPRAKSFQGSRPASSGRGDSASSSAKPRSVNHSLAP